MNGSQHSSQLQPFDQEKRSRRLRRLGVAGTVLMGILPLSSRAAGPKAPVPEARLSLDSLGVPGFSSALLNAGASLMTLHFVDDQHLLLTYSLRDLVPRVPGDPPEDEDRQVAALLVELPSGKVLARTKWHLHDHGRYLWSLGEGRYLLRLGEELSTFAPLANLPKGESFERVAFTHRSGSLDAVVVSQDGRLVTVESHRPVKRKLTGMDINLLTHDNLPMLEKPLVYLDFYRIAGAGTAASPLTATPAGMVTSLKTIRLPVDGDGYLVATGGKHGQWAVEFEGFGSKTVPVGIVQSACSPLLELVSSTQWIAFACRGAADSVTLTAYDFAKHEIWEEPLGEMLQTPVLAFAPAASRFAISRRTDTLSSPLGQSEQSTLWSQEIRVYGTQTGDLLLTIDGQPAVRSSENFDLSPNGMRLAVVRNGALEVYHLPELTKVDREDLVELKKLMPPEGSGEVTLRRLAERDSRNAGSDASGPSRVASGLGATLEPAKGESAASSATASTPSGAAPAPGPAATATVDPGAATKPAQSSTPAGDASPSGDTETHRKPPTLLNPGEHPEGKPKSTASNTQQ